MKLDKSLLDYKTRYKNHRKITKFLTIFLLCSLPFITSSKTSRSTPPARSKPSAQLLKPFKKSAILTIDGVGEWATASIGIGENNSIKMLKEMSFPNSVGLLYSAFTQFVGFKVNSGEYKMMSLAPYGKPIYYDTILKYLVEIK